MTSMMDILTVLLLFLLKSFVVDAEPVTPAAGLELPRSTSPDAPEPSLVVAILDDVILLGGEPVARVAEVTEGDDLVIPALARELAALDRRRETLRELRGDAAPESPRVTVQGDRNMQFQVLERVMTTLSRGGYRDIALAVIKTS